MNIDSTLSEAWADRASDAGVCLWRVSAPVATVSGVPIMLKRPDPSHHYRPSCAAINVRGNHNVL